MKLESILQSAAACFLTLALSAATPYTASGQDQTSQKDPNNRANKQSKMSKDKKDRGVYDNVMGVKSDDEKHSKKAAQLFKEIMKTQGKMIPQNVFDRAECVAAFPGVHTAGPVVSGRGVVSCRTASDWSAPVYLTIRGDNLGSQIGAQTTDLVMMFMNRVGMISMLDNKFTVGVDAPAAAGPVGQDTGTSTDAVMNAQMLCYLRNKGILAGAMMDGAMVEMDRTGMRDVYGDNFSFKEILEGAKTKANSKVMAFSETLARYTPRQARK